MNTDKELLETMSAILNDLCVRAIHYDEGDPKRIQHLIKVHYFARLIGMCEQVAPEVLFILEAAAIGHDIGIPVCEKKYGACDGKHQELEGPAVAKKILSEAGGFTSEQMERVCWLVGHHHTYHDIKDMDHQILVEADFLVNIYEDNLPTEAVRKVKQTIFKTKAGIDLLDKMFLQTYSPAGE